MEPSIEDAALSKAKGNTFKQLIELVKNQNFLKFYHSQWKSKKSSIDPSILIIIIISSTDYEKT